MAEKAGSVCVTGAGGYVASWLIKFLLSRNYVVHGTVRDPEDPKHCHLKNLENGSENLKLFKADLLDYDSLYSAIKGCSGVFHVASPVPSGSVPNPEVELVEPALKGTLNVLKACSAANIKRTVVVSSMAAVIVNSNWPEGQDMDETCWSDKEECKTINNWYCYSKTVAENEAFEYAKQHGLNVVTVCPSLVFGPMLQPTMNSSSWVLVKLVKEGYEEIENRVQILVDVRDVAEALILVYERPEAEGRYICYAYTVESSKLVEILRKNYPDLNYPKRFKEKEERKNKYSSEKLQSLGWKYRPLEETLVDSIESYKQAGFVVEKD